MRNEQYEMRVLLSRIQNELDRYRRACQMQEDTIKELRDLADGYELELDRCAEVAELMETYNDAGWPDAGEPASSRINRQFAALARQIRSDSF